MGPGNCFLLNRTALKNEINPKSSPFESNEVSSFGRFKAVRKTFVEFFDKKFGNVRVASLLLNLQDNVTSLLDIKYVFYYSL